MAIQIPAPLPSDSDKVANLLQNAALFGRIGDTEEALHWLRQAAECAGDSGDDARTLALARSAAELNLVRGPGTDANSDGGSGVHERRLPAPPPRAFHPSTDEPAFLLKRTAPLPKALDTRAAEALDATAAAEALDAAAAEDTSTEVRAPDSRSTLTPPPLPSARANGSRPPLANGSRPPLASTLPPASRPAPPSMRSRTPAPKASRPSPVSTRAPAAVSSVAVAPAPLTRRSTPAPEPAAPAVSLPSLRQAARVSVERSSSEPGLFLVRLLEEGSAPNSGCTEALLVTVDPNTHPFGV